MLSFFLINLQCDHHECATLAVRGLRLVRDTDLGVRLGLAGGDTEEVAKGGGGGAVGSTRRRRISISGDSDA
jgi:hypothetical protein